ncbi:16S rRNA (cytosine(1407)-C(5))-methyltransferase RsmF [Rosenbergiella australiborealis]|uniref:Ribosomal RNA small subunit methyltransferase F n=2 Tax=Rosenbergiella TaxID=1356488 RepID=A0ABS5T1S3_9GAMM|nr:16S rRNA (cytosine(1407)-C(5))-methyltransferase RsmF [Rosenbergiella australiborealis]MBT0726280.1 16S rRNA (cytosine(1407)-C(5))-methyltransferase RsmF [Rosenbergiella australiborealis]
MDPIVSAEVINFPPQFLELMHQALPDENDFADFIAISQRPLRRAIRVNTLKISVENFLVLTAEHPWELTPVPWCQEGFWVVLNDEQIPLGSYAEHLSGLFYIQEPSSMLPVTALFAGEERPLTLMDMAAAPGSKTTQIAANMANHGLIIANEYAASRVKVLHANLSRCGVTNSVLTHFDARVFGAALPEQFDAILLDAPCSGEGVIRKDPQAFSQWSLESTHEIAQTQRELLFSAFHALKPGGRLIYSTCTLNQIENQQVVASLLAQFPDAVTIESLHDLFPGAESVVTAEGFLHIFPQRFDSEGFFVASLRKTASVTPLPLPSYKIGKLPFQPVSRLIAQQVTQLAESVGITWDDRLNLWQRDNELWLFPKLVEPLMNKVKFSRLGFRLADIHNKGYRWHHEAIIALAKPTPSTLALSAEEAAEWYRGRDIYPNSPLPKGECLLSYQQQVLGLAKVVNQRIKNSLPRELARNGPLFK